MSAQSIIEFSKKDVNSKIDDFLICEGNLFRNIIDYDLDFKMDYDKIRKIIYVKNLIKRKKDCETGIDIIYKILK